MEALLELLLAERLAIAVRFLLVHVLDRPRGPSGARSHLAFVPA
jgi:hypothetical protein